MMNRAVARLAEQLAAQPESDFIALDSASDFGSAALLDGRSERGAERASGMALASAAETDRPLSKVLSEYAITQAELARQRLFVERLTAVMPNTLRLFSRAEQRSLWINRHLGACLGYSAQDIALLGEDFLLRVLHPDDVPALARHQERVFLSADGEVLEFEFRARDSTGRWRWLLQHDTVFRRDMNGQTIDMVGTITDITDRKSAESALKVALALAENANRSKSEFLSKMSHELRSPLNAMLGFAQLMESDSPEASASDQESVTEILKAGWYLLELIEQILDFSLMESGHLSLTLEPVALQEVLRDCQSIVVHQARLRGITLLFPDAGDAELVFADRTRLKQVLINLLSNAVKYNRASGTVRVSVQSRPPMGLRICVEDDGNGLLPGQLENLFQPFERLGQELGRIEGTGIGLAVSKSLVERMGGQIGADSAIGLGSRFWVDLVVAGRKSPPCEIPKSSGMEAA